MGRTRGSEKHWGSGLQFCNSPRGFFPIHIQLQFEDRGVTAINLPSVTANGETNTPGRQRYRDLLCDRIGHRVVETELIENERIWLKFDDDSTISISLRSEDSVSPEAAILYVNERTWVW